MLKTVEGIYQDGQIKLTELPPDISEYTQVIVTFIEPDKVDTTKLLQLVVESSTREEAITEIKAAFLERLKHIETISWDMPVETSEPAWMKFAGIFKDDSDFQGIMNQIQAERNSDDESEVDPSYYL